IRGTGREPALSRSGTDAAAIPKRLLRLSVGSRSEQPALRAARRGDPQVIPSGVVEAASACSAGDQAELAQEGFDHVFDRIPRLGKPGSEGFYANRTSLVGLGNHGEVAAVHRVEAERID